MSIKRHRFFQTVLTKSRFYCKLLSEETLMKEKSKLGIMIDCSRNSVCKPEMLEKLFPLLGAMGYDSVQLYTEDTYEIENEPYFGYLRGRYTQSEFKRIDAAASKNGIELIPCIQTLAHLPLRWERFRPIKDTDEILLADDEDTYKFIDEMFSSAEKCFTSRKINIGMDEAHMLGLGKYLEKHGYVDRKQIMLRHVRRVAEIAKKHGFECMMWGDMFACLAESDGACDFAGLIPDNVKLIFWEYSCPDKRYDIEMLQKYKKITDRVMFAGGLWDWLGLAPLNAFSFRVATAGLAACRDENIDEVFFTMWGDNGGSGSPFSLLPALLFAAEKHRGNDDMNLIKQKFRDIVGMDFDDYMRLDLPNAVADYGEETLCSNASKYLLYNDPLLGIYDPTIDEGDGDIYLSHAEKLKECENNENFGFIFRVERLLCETLYYKADLGLRLRRLYKNGDKKGLEKLATERIKPCIKKLEEFHAEFAKYWEKLYKPHGFDVMDLRLGGLKARLNSAKRKIEEYASGARERIEELEEEIIDPTCSNGENKMLALYSYRNIATVNRI